MSQGVQVSNKIEFRPDYYILDVGDMFSYSELCIAGEHQRRGLMYTFGGLIGEIIMTYTTLQDYCLAQPSWLGNKLVFNAEQFELVLNNVVEKSEMGKINLGISQDWNNDSYCLDDQLKKVKTYMANIGLKFMIDTARETNIDHGLIDEVLKALIQLQNRRNEQIMI